VADATDDTSQVIEWIPTQPRIRYHMATRS
jgi:hypothetical protein